MIYKEFKPNKELRPYIETYWTACGDLRGEESYKVLPDGCLDIIFSFGDTPSHCGLDPFAPNIVGTMTTYSVGLYLNQVRMLGIRFKPTGFTAFTRIPIHEFSDRLINLQLVESLFDERFYADLPLKESMEDRIEHIDSYFLRKLSFVYKPENRIVYAVELINQTKGLLSLTDVADKSCLSLRQFERRFKAAVGVSPKTFSKIIKFKNTRSYLKKNSETDLLSVAVDCGYYDQAHLIKDFRALTGDAPSTFRK